MKQLEIIEFPGQENVLENYQYYKNKFLENSVLVFRNANLNHDQQKKFHISLGEKFGWSSIEGDNSSYYIENHAHNELIKKVSSDEIMLNWHIEHVHHENPISAATWNMYKFSENEESGKTYFIDTSKIYDSLPLDFQEFLQKSQASSKNFMMSNQNDPRNKIETNYHVLKKHWISGKMVIRVNFPKDNKSFDELSFYDGQKPNNEQKEKFIEICKYINNEIWNNKNLIMYHKWRQGDLLIPDMFKLAHAVTGGFDPQNREFCGRWGLQF